MHVEHAPVLKGKRGFHEETWLCCSSLTLHWPDFSHSPENTEQGIAKRGGALLISLDYFSDFFFFLNNLFVCVHAALHAASLSDHVSTVKLLLDRGAMVDSLDVMKHTPLFRACEMGHRDVILTLIKGGCGWSRMLSVRRMPRLKCKCNERRFCSRGLGGCGWPHCSALGSSGRQCWGLPDTDGEWDQSQCAGMKAHMQKLKAA